MGLKDEVKQAKARIQELFAEGKTIPQVAGILNAEFDGFFYFANGSIYLENIPDCAPPIRVW